MTKMHAVKHTQCKVDRFRNLTTKLLDRGKSPIIKSMNRNGFMNRDDKTEILECFSFLSHQVFTPSIEK